MDLVFKVIPEPSEDDLVKIYLQAQTSLWKMGLTGVQRYGSAPQFCRLAKTASKRSTRHAGRKKYSRAQFSARAVALGLRTGFGDDFLRIGSLKLFADGALGPQTAAMFQPYENSSNDVGILLMDSEQVFEYGQEATQNGISLAIHSHRRSALTTRLSKATRVCVNLKARNTCPTCATASSTSNCCTKMTFPISINSRSSLRCSHSTPTSDMFISDQYWGKRSANSLRLGNGAPNRSVPGVWLRRPG